LLKAQLVASDMSKASIADQLKELEATKLKMLLHIKELKEKLAQEKEDSTDIYFFLNRKCDESYEVIAALEEQLMTEQKDRENVEKQLERQIEDLQSGRVIVVDGQYVSYI